ncbi:MAG: LURP-one-related family protein [Firmicutes bacterium]|nr:LURP-one-related family protein [Bacillota bacterium]
MSYMFSLFLALFILIAIAGIGLGVSKQRYREPGEGSDYRNLNEFGEPARTLYTSSEIFTLHHRIEITDEYGSVAYRAETQFPSIHDKTDIYDADGRHVAHIERKLISIHEIRYIDMADGSSFILSNELFHLIRDVTNLEGLGWILEGNLLQLNFTIKDAEGALIALVSQKFMSIHDKYAVDIYMPQHEEKVVAILIALQHMICDRQAAASSSGGGGVNAQ